MTSANPAVPATTVSRRVASFVDSLDDTIVTRQQNTVIERISDTVAVGVAGASSPPIKALASAQPAAHSADGGTARIWRTGALTTAPAAALVNAAATHAEDFDDTHTAGVVHGSACVVPAAWAAAEARDLTMRDVYRGVLAGWEVAARLGIVSDGAFHRRGLHPTSVVGAFGAAAAVAAVWRLPAAATVSALGLAGSATSGLNAYLQDGTQGKLLNPGFAAQAGYQAASFAEAGVAGPAAVFEGRFGLYDALGEGSDESVLAGFSDLGEVWQIEQVSTKPYPACHFAHATIDAALELRTNGVRVDDISHITCHLPGPTLDLLSRPWADKLDPPSAYAVRFSAPWLVAIALIDGNVGRDTFTHDLPRRNEVRRLAGRVEVVEWAGSSYPDTFPGWVDVRDGEGRVHTARREVNRGHPRQPLTAQEIRGKFRSCFPRRGDTQRPDALLRQLGDPTVGVRDLSRQFG